MLKDVSFPTTNSQVQQVYDDPSARPNYSWDSALRLWYWTGEFKGIASAIRDKVDAPEGYELVIAAIVEGRAERHKTRGLSQYRDPMATFEHVVRTQRAYDTAVHALKQEKERSPTARIDIRSAAYELAAEELFRELGVKTSAASVKRFIEGKNKWNADFDRREARFKAWFADTLATEKKRHAEQVANLRHGIERVIVGINLRDSLPR
jgi:hypothetical protein